MEIKQDGPVVLSCNVPGCGRKSYRPSSSSRSTTSRCTPVTSKPDKPKRPELKMSGDAVEATDFDRFTFLFLKYRNMAGINGDAPSHLLECLGRDIMAILFRHQRLGHQRPNRATVHGQHQEAGCEAEKNCGRSHGDVPVKWPGSAQGEVRVGQDGGLHRKPCAV